MMLPGTSDFDKAARYAARYLDPHGLLQWLMGEEFWRAWRWANWLQTEAIPFPGEPGRRADFVAGFTRRAGDAAPVAAVVEFMTEPRAEILKRLAEYAFLISRSQPFQENPRVEYDVFGVVMTLTGAFSSGDILMRPPDCGGLGFTGSVRPVNLSTVDARAVLAAIGAGGASRGLLAWLPLMAGGSEPSLIPEWKRLAELEPQERKRGDLGGLAKVFANLAGCLPAWRDGLEDWNVERSIVVQEWEARGEARGLAEGEARGRLVEAREKVILALEIRLGAPPPKDVTDAVQRQPDLPTLDRWFASAVRAATVEEFRQAAGLPAN